MARLFLQKQANEAALDSEDASDSRPRLCIRQRQCPRFGGANLGGAGFPANDRRLTTALRLHPTLQNQHRRHLVYHFPSALDRHFGLAE